jgi:hypothetical protein
VSQVQQIKACSQEMKNPVNKSTIAGSSNSNAIECISHNKEIDNSIVELLDDVQISDVLIYDTESIVGSRTVTMQVSNAQSPPVLDNRVRVTDQPIVFDCMLAPSVNSDDDPHIIKVTPKYATEDMEIVFGVSNTTAPETNLFCCPFFCNLEDADNTLSENVLGIINTESRSTMQEKPDASLVITAHADGEPVSPNGEHISSDGEHVPSDGEICIVKSKSNHFPSPVPTFDMSQKLFDITKFGTPVAKTAKLLHLAIYTLSYVDGEHAVNIAHTNTFSEPSLFILAHPMYGPIVFCSSKQWDRGKEMGRVH